MRSGWSASTTVSVLINHRSLEFLLLLRDFYLTSGHRDPAGFTTHATDDVDGHGKDYTSAARELRNDWVNHGDLGPNALKPYQNAENIAAAATEWWFLQSCGFRNISL